MSLVGKHVLITGSVRRIGKALALGVANAGGIVSIHTGHSGDEGRQLLALIRQQGHEAHLVQSDLSDPEQAADLVQEACQAGHLHALVNNAAIFENLTWENTDLDSWQRHLNINLTAPFLLSQAFARQIPPGGTGKIVNILDWRAMRPGADHLPYTISKAGLAALTQSLAVALAPNIQVNGIALGAILPPSDGADVTKTTANVPARRWSTLEEVVETLLFLLDGPAFITGEIIHLDGGRHLV
jgi:NAD(P)-dependent dehydrogenase (short-subunit alcohol dehydrogenase family)